MGITTFAAVQQTYQHVEAQTMDDLRINADPARIDAAIRDARRIRNEVLADLVKALFDGRALARLTGESKARTNDLPKGSAPQS